MRKTPLKSKSLCLTAIFALLTGAGLSSCASKNMGPFSNEQIDENLYFQEVNSQEDQAFKNKLSKSSFRLMRATYNSFLKDALRYQERNAWLDTLPKGMSHGDAHIQQATWRDGVLSLDDWDTLDRGPYWLDIVRAESSSLIWSKGLGFRNNYSYPCINAYTDAFVRNKHHKAPAAFDQYIETNAAKDLSTHNLWLNASPIPEDSQELLKAFLLHAKNNQLPINDNTQVKSLKSGVGSYTKEKMIFLTSDNMLWELKEVDVAPYLPFNQLSKSGDLCGRYESIIKHQAELKTTNSYPKDCFSFDGRLFTVLKWSHSYFALKDKHIKRYEDLEDYTKWFCSSLAKLHERSMGKPKKKKWTMLLKSPAPLQTTLKRMTQEIATRNEEAYRMLLLSLEE